MASRACPPTRRSSGGLNTQAIGGYLNLGRRSSTPQFQNPTVLNPKVNYTRMFAQHSLKLGYEYQHIDTGSSRFQSAVRAGQLQRPIQRTHRRRVEQHLQRCRFSVRARSAYQLTNVFTAQYRQRMNFFYVQDDWKVSGN